MGIAAVFPVVIEDPRISIKYPTGFTFPSSFLSKPSPVRIIVLDLGQKTVDKHSHPRRSISSTCIFFPQKEKKASKISRRTIFQSPGTEFSRTNALTRVSLTRWKGQEARETGISAWIEGRGVSLFHFPIARRCLSRSRFLSTVIERHLARRISPRSIPSNLNTPLEALVSFFLFSATLLSLNISRRFFLHS